ncbi:MAG: bifunctional precorrin-2 dehydrogenase/sirohydrochlorin ferrochelatase [Clostridiales bacterium]|nr:bifunctional precorrin-2 dehydrogenase/sirohydrochlorin ferrochelatase [Clostridiales bacterium]
MSNKNILIVGGGAVADRRVHTLLPFAGELTVVSPEFTEGLKYLAQNGQIQITERTFEPVDITGRDLVLAATDDNALNRQIAALCRARGIPVNVSSDRMLCDFQFPSVLTDGEVVIGINASGENHSLVKETRKRLETVLHSEQEA